LARLFPLGTVVIRPSAQAALAEAAQSAEALLERHVSGNWGQVRARDRLQNAAALRRGRLLLSAYVLPTGVRVLVVTTGDRHTTTIMLPALFREEYPAA
jgi:hypothetical protein